MQGSSIHGARRLRVHRPRGAFAAAVAVAALATLGGGAGPAGATNGDPYVKSCLTSGAITGCSSLAGLTGARPEALSPDGKQLYVATSGGTPNGGGAAQSAGLLVFDRNATTGAVTYRSFATTSSIANPQDILVSPDGKNVYVSNAGNAITEFGRGADGSLSALSESITTGTGWGQPHGLAMDAGSKDLYVSTASGTVLVFSRNAATGNLTQLADPSGCYSETAVSGCTTSHGIANRSWQIALSPDDSNLYVTGYTDSYTYYYGVTTCHYYGYPYSCGYAATAPTTGTVAIFKRNADGSLSQSTPLSINDCISNNGLDGGTPGSGSSFPYWDEGAGAPPYYVSSAGSYPPANCKSLGQASLARAESVAVSPDGKNVYVGTDTSLVTLTRGSGGALSFAGCARRPGSGVVGCTDASSVGTTYRVAVTPDGKGVISNSNDAGAGFAFFSRDPSTGALTPQPGTKGCVTQSGTSGACETQAALGGLGSIAISPDSLFVYLTGQTLGTLATYDRDFAPLCQPVSVNVPFNTATAVQFRCSDVNNDALTYAIVDKPAGGGVGTVTGSQVFYNPFSNYSGPDSFTYEAIGNGVASAPAKVTLKVNALPVAAFTPSPASAPSLSSFSFDGSGSHDPDGSIGSYSWSFGDGASGTGSSVQHAYAHAGTYTVQLTVTDSTGATASVSHPVTVLNVAPTAAFDPNTGVASSLSSFSFDGSGSRDADGSISSYSWSFGDGASGTGSSVQHAYAHAGTYTVQLTVTDNDGATTSVTHSVTVLNRAPTAAVAASPGSAPSLSSFSFDGSGSRDADGTISSYSWSFGDGASGAGSTAHHAYAHPGTHTVQLTVTDDSGATASATQAVTVLDLAPAGKGVVSPSRVVHKRAAKFTAAVVDRDSAKLSFRWTFGDGKSAGGRSVKHAYAKAGRYKVTLVVNDHDGHTVRIRTTVRVR